MTETRILLRDTGVVDAEYGAIRLRVIQEPIPWCTTHDTKGNNDHLMFHRGAKICLISTGDPDHKWWMDR